MLDDDYMPLAEAIRLACVKNRGSLSPRDIAQGHAKRSGHRVECVDGAVALSVGLSPSRARAVHAACAPPSPSPDDTALVHNLRAFVLQHPSGSRRAYGAWSSRLASPATVVNRFGSWWPTYGEQIGGHREPAPILAQWIVMQPRRD